MYIYLEDVFYHNYPNCALDLLWLLKFITGNA
jgi:hypothetical protein